MRRSTEHGAFEVRRSAGLLDRPRRDAAGRRRLTRIGLAIAAVAVLGLSIAAHEVPYFAVDVGVTRLVQRLDTPWLVAPLDLLSAIGFPPVVGIVYGSIALALFLLGRRRDGIAAAIATLGAAGLNFTSKALVARPRPPTSLVHVEHHITNSTYPAGHVLNATAFMGFLCYLAWTEMRPSWRRTALIAVLLLAIVGMGIARLHSGEHWLSDVLGGYLIGALWLRVAIALHRRLAGRRAPSLPRPLVVRTSVAARL